ncbi:MAG: hypothetical protein ACTSQQ_11145 [Candidatus Helarchaeota archaeon]
MVSTTDLISAVIILIAVLINSMIGIKSFKSYRENKLTQTLLFSLTAFFMAIAMTLLVVEKLFLSSTIPDETLGMIFGSIAIIMSGFAVVCIDGFAFNMVFPKQFKFLTIIAAAVEVLYLGFWLGDPVRHVEWGLVNGELTGEIVLGNFTTILPFFTLVPLLLIPVLVFFYYAIKVRDESPVSSKRSWILGFGVLLISTGFILEIIGLDPEIYEWVIVGARSLFIFGALLLYWGLFRIRAKE